MITAFRFGTLPRLRPLRRVAFLSFALILTMLAGCGGMTKPQIGPIQFTTAAGATAPPDTSLSVNQQVYLVANVTSDDQILGISWTVTCGSATGPGGTSIDTSCGACNPAHTESGPVPLYPATGIVTTYTAPSAVPKGATVTITAHATALPSVTSSVTIAIDAAQASREPAAAGKGHGAQVRSAGTDYALAASGTNGKALNSGL